MTTDQKIKAVVSNYQLHGIAKHLAQKWMKQGHWAPEAFPFLSWHVVGL